MSPDKIHVSTLKGEGDLSNLELDEKLLTELLDLPTWIKISKAVCNRVAIKVSSDAFLFSCLTIYMDYIAVQIFVKFIRIVLAQKLYSYNFQMLLQYVHLCHFYFQIQWTKLKSQPICLVNMF